MTGTDDIIALEARLRDAVLAGDADVLDRLLADDIVYSAPDGQSMSKADDLAMYRSGRLRVTRLDFDTPDIRIDGDVADVDVRASLTGALDDVPFEGRFRYRRRWRRAAGGWQVAEAACTTVDA